ncbi:hypothetical protein VT84_09370 [Gemmata sp. SH-PL17]|uniref:DUF6575 domain-containing protein n=1 Tax=Gemmata sp. SH-PL17 TaxID=1630693 RepID=UPI00078D8A1F|nr:hypothetical protein VT84_09370 [Gemmata sp. SH-PL17]
MGAKGNRDFISWKGQKMWAVKGQRRRPSSIKIEPATVLYEYDGPRIFTCDVGGKLFLAYQCGEDEKRLRFLLVPTTSYAIWTLVKGYQDLRSMIAVKGARLVDLAYDGETQSYWDVSVLDIPHDVLPKHGVMLWPQHASIVRPFSISNASASNFSTVSLKRKFSYAQSF